MTTAAPTSSWTEILMADHEITRGSVWGFRYLDTGRPRYLYLLAAASALAMAREKTGGDDVAALTIPPFMYLSVDGDR